MIDLARVAGGRLAYLRAEPADLPPAARMVTLGHGLAGWLRRA